MTVYVLLLENDKYYIGFTNRDVDKRFTEHLSGKGAQWTKKYPMVDVVAITPGDETKEKELTLEYMQKYGWWNIRGGPWCQIDMEHPPLEIRPAEPPTLKQKLKICAHIEESKEKAEQKQEENVCVRCGRTSHTAEDCYAKIHLNGKYIPAKRAVSALPKQTTVECVKKTFKYSKEDDHAEKKCFRCGRSSHLAVDCYAKTDSDGNSL